MKISELGEFGLIELIRRQVASASTAQPQVWAGVRLGIGDDAACWEGVPGLELATTDTLVQGVHFQLDTATWEELGWKALAVNVSDIAAMGGVSRYILVTLALPGHILVENISQLYTGLLEAAHHYRVAIVGGDVVTSPCILITLALWGSLEGGILLTRSAAQPGDLVAVTGWVGDAAGGLAMLKEGHQIAPETASHLRRAHFRPQPRAAEGPLLARLGVRAAIDISDGLVADLGHICRESGVSANVHIDQLPLSLQLQAAFGKQAIHLALFGGEDYELLFTAPRSVLERIKHAVACPVTIIGEVVAGEPGKVILLDKDGQMVPWERGGWDHFAL